MFKLTYESEKDKTKNAREAEHEWIEECELHKQRKEEYRKIIKGDIK